MVAAAPASSPPTSANETQRHSPRPARMWVLRSSHDPIHKHSLLYSLRSGLSAAQTMRKSCCVTIILFTFITSDESQSHPTTDPSNPARMRHAITASQYFFDEYYQDTIRNISNASLRAMGAIVSAPLPEKISRTEAVGLFGSDFDEKRWNEMTNGSSFTTRDELLEYAAGIADDGQDEGVGGDGQEECEECCGQKDELSFTKSQFSVTTHKYLSPSKETMKVLGDVSSHHASVAESFFAHLKAFFEHKRQIDALWESLGCQRIQDIEPIENVSGRQTSTNGMPVESIDDLYHAATQAKPAFEMLMRRTCKTADIAASNLKLAPLKGIARALEKANHEYADKPGSPLSWVSDVVRCSVICDEEKEAVAFFEALSNAAGVEVVRLNNRFKHPTPAGFRDINVKISVEPAVVAPALSSEFSEAVQHVCEIQVHLRPLALFSKEKHSHRFYKFFRHYFRGQWSEVSEQSRALESLLEAGTGSLHAAVQLMLDEEESKEGKARDVSATRSSATLDALAQLADETLGMSGIAAKLYQRLATNLAEELGTRRHVSVGIARMKQGHALLQLNANDDAIDAFKAALVALQTHPQNYVMCSTGLGQALMRRGDLEAASRTYSQALGLLKQTKMERYAGVVLCARMQLHITKGLYDAALEDISVAEGKLKELVSSEGPDIGMCWLQRSKALYAKAEESGAAENFELQRQLIAEALSEANRAHELLHRICGDMSRRLGEAYLQKARILLLKGDLQSAETAASEAVHRVKSGSELAHAHEVHAQALERIGRDGDARASRREAANILRANGKGSEALIRVVLADSAAYLRTSDVKKALELAETSLQDAIECYGPNNMVVVNARRHVAKLHEENHSIGQCMEQLESAILALYHLLGAKENSEDKLAVHGYMLKGPPALTIAAGDTHYAYACVAEHTRDTKKAIHHYKSAALFLRAARGDSCLAAKRIEEELQRLREKADYERSSNSRRVITTHANGATSPRRLEHQRSSIASTQSVKDASMSKSDSKQRIPTTSRGRLTRRDTVAFEETGPRRRSDQTGGRRGDSIESEIQRHRRATSPGSIVGASKKAPAAKAR